MKKSMLAILVLGTVSISAIVLGCSQPAAQPAAMNGLYTAPTEAPSIVAVAVATDVERLEEMQGSIQLLIMQSLMNGVVVSDALNDQTQSIEKAKQELIALDGQRCGTHMLINQYLMSGQPVPECEYELAQSIEQARQDVLKRVGLAD